ncbi:hypothetical protein GVX82_02460 [Patescibacteria group bacterium]|nr:hypothetical protein [Patescibacteria group bacterium]
MDIGSPHIERLLARLAQVDTDDPWSAYTGPRFQTNAITSRAGAVYEKVRYAVDYQEENLIRRAAIERILRRLVLFESSSELGTQLLTDLVRGGYIRTDTLPEAIAREVQELIEKYRVLATRLGSETPPVIWSYAAAEIEQHLFPAHRDAAVLDALYAHVLEYVAPREPEAVDDAFFKLEVYIACRRLFLRDGPAETRFALFAAMHPHWRSLSGADEEGIAEVAARFAAIEREIDGLLASPLSFKIEAYLKNEAIYFSLVRRMIAQFGAEAREVFAEPERLAGKVRTYMHENYRALADRTARAGTRAIIYVLITKVIVGLAVELPYELLVLGEIHYLPLAVNMLFFPILLFFMVKTVQLPGPENTEAAVTGVQTLVAGHPHPQIFVPVAERSLVQKLSFGLFYLIFAGLSFGAIVWCLLALNFNLASMGLFLFFLTVVSYFGLRIRYRAREWTVERGEESVLGLVWYLLSLPVIRTGRWVATRLSSVNVFVLFMDVILETPFKLLLGSFDAFITFAKETKRESV